MEISQQIPLICKESYEMYAVSGGGVGSRCGHGLSKKSEPSTLTCRCIEEIPIEAEYSMGTVLCLLIRRKWLDELYSSFKGKTLCKYFYWDDVIGLAAVVHQHITLRQTFHKLS